jgi:hypothetical protein
MVLSDITCWHAIHVVKGIRRDSLSSYQYPRGKQLIMRDQSDFLMIIAVDIWDEILDVLSVIIFFIELSSHIL